MLKILDLKAQWHYTIFLFFHFLWRLKVYFPIQNLSPKHFLNTIFHFLTKILPLKNHIDRNLK